MFRPLLDIIAHWAAEAPEKVAFHYPSFDSGPDREITYAGLLTEAARIGEWLHARKATQRPVVQLLPTGPEFITSFLGCFYAGAIAVPAPAPDATRTATHRSSSRLERCAAPSSNT